MKSNFILIILILFINLGFSDQKPIFSKINLRFKGRHEFDKFEFEIKYTPEKACDIILFDYKSEVIFNKKDYYICELFNGYFFDEYEINQKVKNSSYRLPGSYVDPIELEIIYLVGGKIAEKKIIVPNEGVTIYKGSIAHMAHKMKNFLNKKYLSF